MTRYRMGDGTIVNAALAKKSWQEGTRWNGSNHISRATGSQWQHQTLHLSNKGRYWLECTSDDQSQHPSAHWLEPVEAASWLLMNDHDLPENLAEYQGEVEE